MDAATVPDRRAGSLYFLAERLETHANFAEVIASLLAGHGATLGGVWGSSCALAAAASDQSAQQADAAAALQSVVPQLAEGVAELTSSRCS